MCPSNVTPDALWAGTLAVAATCGAVARLCLVFGGGGASLGGVCG